MISSPRSQVTTSTTSDASASPLDDRLRALTETQSDDDTLPQICGVRLIRDGPDSGLYQITVVGFDGVGVPLGRSNGLEKASEIHDMVTVGIHGRDCLLNFSPSRFHMDAYINVLLTFRKLFPGNLFWTAIQKGIEAGVQTDSDPDRRHPVLDTFFGYASTRSQSATCEPWTPRAIAKWPPFCPPWLLTKTFGDAEPSPAIDASVVVRGVDGSDSMEATTSIDERKYEMTKHRPYRVPRNGVVAHHILHPFAPPQPVMQSVATYSDLEASRRTRRGRCVKQPMRYREDNHLDLSDSDAPETGFHPKMPKIEIDDFRFESTQKTTLASTIPVVKTPSTAEALSRRETMKKLCGSYDESSFAVNPSLQCYTSPQVLDRMYHHV